MKICKDCNNKKPLKDFNRNGKDNRCRVCSWFKRNEGRYSIKKDWNKNLYYVLLDNLLNRRIDYLNEMESVLDKKLKDICDVCSNYLKLKGTIKMKIKINCTYCNKEIILTPAKFLSQNKYFCSKKCTNKFKKGKNYHKIINKSNCVYCNKEINIYDNVPQQKFCSKHCQYLYNKINGFLKEISICSNCGKKVYKNKTQISKYKNVFCSKECEKQYKFNLYHKKINCEECGKELIVQKSSKQRFCSIACQSKWQSKTFIGENSATYNHNYSKKDRTIICEWCGKEHIVNMYDKIKGKARFCSNKCRREWYAKIWSQSKEWKQQSRLRAVSILERGLISKTQSGCQQKINKLLDIMRIKYINEKGFKYYAVDNYLTDYNLIIEVMGTYWHCDIRKFNMIKYSNQRKRIIKDKAKRTYLKNKYGIKVLYLWEEDINNNIDLCKEIILKYIENKGELNNYQSLNYNVNNGILNLNNNLIIPYMEQYKKSK